jgi:alpha-beta hydrolase superfamily lysophospholipase
MDHREENIIGADGENIYRCSWIPDGVVRAQCTLLHGYGEHCHRYEALVGALNDAGIAVFALDHKGHGRSKGRSAYITDFRSLVPDAVTTLRWAADQAPGVPRVLFGHSMGGALAALLAMDHPELIDLLALSAPAVKISEDISPFLQKISGIVSTLMPLLPVEKIDTALLSRDPEVVDDYNADPLVYHGGIAARSGHSLLSSERLILARAAALNTPVLLQHGTADGLADPAGSTRLHEGASSADKTLKMYEGFYHEIFNEPEQAQVRADLLSWLDQRLSAGD